MVSTRRTPAPPSPPSLTGARLVPDDPPPLPLRAASPARGALSRPTATDALVAQAKIDSPAIPGVLALPALPTTSGRDDVSDDSEAPDEELASAVAAAAREQLRKERVARASVVEARHARRRAHGKASELVAGEVKRREADLAEIDVDRLDVNRDGNERGTERVVLTAGVQTSHLLSNEVLHAAASAVGERREIQKQKKRQERMRKQRGVVGRKKVVRELFGGLQVAVAGREGRRVVSKTRNGRQSAAEFLTKSLRNAGLPRVPAATASRIASKRKMLED